jgi:hypothetical protein
VRYNWARVGSGFPKLKARRIGEQADWRTLSFAVRNYVGAGIIKPDDPLEAAIRDEMGLPPADPATARETATPQNPSSGGAGAAGDKNAPSAPTPPKAGPPRQAAPSANPPKGNSGNDRSGGK